MKPLNIVRIRQTSDGDSRWLLIDLDAASEIGRGFVGLKSSTAVRSQLLLLMPCGRRGCRFNDSHSFVLSPHPLQFLPPEMLYKDSVPSGSDKAAVAASSSVSAAVETPAPLGGDGWRVMAVDSAGTPLDSTQKFQPLLAHVSFDMWCGPYKSDVTFSWQLQSRSLNSVHQSAEHLTVVCLLLQEFWRPSMGAPHAQGSVAFGRRQPPGAKEGLRSPGAVVCGGRKRCCEHGSRQMGAGARKLWLLSRPWLSEGSKGPALLTTHWSPRRFQALFLRLLAPQPSRRPPSMASVIAHPFFAMEELFEAPKLREGEKNNVFLSHFQGNAVRISSDRRCRTVVNRENRG